MTEEPLCQIRREARARGAVAALVSENLNAVDFNRPNREALLLSCLPAFWFFIVPPLPRALDAGFLLSAELSPLILPLPIAVSSARSRP